MGRTRHILVLVLVATTSVSMVVANTPHVSCRCVNGLFKPICYTPDAYCHAPPDAEQLPCCCPTTIGQIGNPSYIVSASTDGTIEARTCQRTFVASEDFSRLEQEILPEGGQLVSPQSVLACSTIDVDCSRARLAQASSLRPPPTDFIVLFSHLNI